MTVFKIYINGISDGNLIFRSDVSTALTGYGDTILSPKLKKETNKADSFEFMILPSHEKYGSFEKKKTFVFLTRDDKCIFRGRVSDIKTDIYKQRTITCEGDLAFLADSIQPPNKKNETSSVGSTKKKKNSTVYSTDGGRTYTVVNNKDTLKMTPEAYFRTCIDVHNGQMTNDNKHFTVGSVTVTGKGTNEYFERTSYQDTSSVISSDLLSVYGGVLRTRYENGQAYIDWLDAYTKTNSQEIRFGVNMIDMDQEPPTDEIWSVLLPTGEENCTIESKNDGSKFLENPDAIERYGYIVHHHAFSNVKKAGELLTKARKYMSTHCKIFPNNLVIKAIDLQLIGESNDPLELGDKIKVASSPHGLEKTMACIAMELDIYNPENNSYTIGTILPPDKEKKKEPLSEKHKNSHGSSSRGIANNANAISGLQNDVNVNANNINVNAENIAVNALNIAVNAENIAVVAKNISIAAETIDIKAQEITATFGKETDKLYGHITTSAEGIKTEFHDNTTGLSSYFTQEAGKVTQEIRNTKTDVFTKITLTEKNITTEFHDVVYGPNDDGGIVGDYTRKIVDSAQGTVDTLHSEFYGEGGTAENPKGGSTFDAVYTKTSQLNQAYFKRTLYGDGGSETDPKENTVLYAVYNQSAAAWSNALWGNGTKDNPASGSILYGTNQEIGARVKKGDVESGFKITGTNLSLFSKTISLSGFVTVDKLSAVDGNITNLVNGTTTASYLLATKMKVSTGNFYIGDSNNTSGQFFYHGTKYYDVSISMPNVGETNGFLGWAYKNGSYPTTLNLAHSHSVTTNTDGTITLGGTVATDSDATIRSFKIADTKTYKDGVSAVVITSLNKDPSASVSYDTDNNKYTVPLKAVASNSNSKTANYTFFATDAYNAGVDSVSIKSVGLNTTDYPTEGVGDSSSFTGAIFYTTSEKNFHVRIRSNATNGKHREASIPIPGDKAYDHGVNSVTITSVNKDPSASVSYDTDNNKYTVPLKAVASNSNSKTANYTFFATDAYNAGQTDESIDTLSWSIPQYSDSDTHQRQMVAVADDNDEVRDCVTFKVTANKSGGGIVTHTFRKVPCWDVYDHGVNSVTITSLNKNPDASVSYSATSVKYTVPLKAVASNGNSKTANYTFFATDAYNAGQTAGVNSVTITSLNKDPGASVSYSATSVKYTVPLKAVASNGNSKTENYTFYATDAYNAGFLDGENYVANSISCNTVRVYADGTARVWVHYNYEGSDKTKTIDIPASGVTDIHS